MGKFNPSGDAVFQGISHLFPGPYFPHPAYFNGVVYYAAINDRIKAFALKNAQFPSIPANKTGTVFAYPGATPSISANGTSDAILWAVENGYSATLHAYDATDLSKELYNSNQAPFVQDEPGPGNNIITSTIANGKVYVGTISGSRSSVCASRDPVRSFRLDTRWRFGEKGLSTPGNDNHYSVPSSTDWTGECGSSLYGRDRRHYLVWVGSPV